MTPLMPHQMESIEEFKKHNGRMLLWSDPGNGKTAVALQCAEKVQGLVLYVCPAIVREQVMKEVAKFTDMLGQFVVDGNAEHRASSWKFAKELPEINDGNLLRSQMFIISFETLVADFDLLKKINWKLIVVDECQRIASPTNKCAKLLKKLSATYRLAMSGTPFPNALHEAWSVIHWLDPNTTLGKSFYEFRRLHCRTNPYIPQQITGYVNEEEIKRVIAQHSHRVFRRDAQTGVPDLEERIEPVRITERERRRYDEFKRDLVLELESGGQLTVPNVLAALMRLRQLIDCPWVLDEGLTEGSKWTAGYRWIIENKKDKKNKLLVFSEFKDPIRRYALLLGEETARVIDGDTPDKKRQETLKAFSGGEFQVLLLSSAGQTGLNIQTANKILHFGVPWNHARLEQRTARAHRKGQLRTVESVIMLAEDTVDSHMYNLVRSKEKLNKEDLKQLLREL